MASCCGRPVGVGISFSWADLWGATGDVAVSQVGVAVWVTNRLRRANWETLAQLEEQMRTF